jgi:hypothetical protein
MADVSIAGLERMLNRDEPKYQKVVDDFKAEIAADDANILWVLRHPESVIGAANALRRISMLRRMVENLRKAQSGEDPEFTARVTEHLGELTDEALIASIDKEYTEQLVRYGRSGRGLGQSDIEYQMDMKFVAEFLDDKLFRWL